jgi:hypothetical protein
MIRSSKQQQYLIERYEKHFESNRAHVLLYIVQLKRKASDQ